MEQFTIIPIGLIIIIPIIIIFKLIINNYKIIPNNWEIINESIYGTIVILLLNNLPQNK